jgi:selenocysteine-specific elongation factor
VISLDVAAGGVSDRILPATLLVSLPGWQQLTQAVRAHLQAFHVASPLRRGMPKEELRTRLGLDGRTFGRVAARLLAEEAVREAGPLLALPDHEVRLTPEMQARIDRVFGELRAAGASPPGRHELETRHGLSSDELAVMIERGQLVEIASDLIYPRDTLDGIIMSVVAALRESGTITVAGVRDLTGTSRKYSLALLAHLDEKRITRRVGDDRVLM